MYALQQFKHLDIVDDNDCCSSSSSDSLSASAKTVGLSEHLNVNGLLQSVIPFTTLHKCELFGFACPSLYNLSNCVFDKYPHLYSESSV